MGTIGEEVLRRIDALENHIANGGAFPDSNPISPDLSNRRLSDQLAELRDRVERMASGSTGAEGGLQKNGMNPKDVLP